MLIRKKHIRLASSFMLACTALTIAAPLSTLGTTVFAETTTAQSAGTTTSTATPTATRYNVANFSGYPIPDLLWNA